MIRIRNFTRDDVAVLKRMYGQLTEAEILAMLDEWNSCELGGKYFESLAVCKEDEVVGVVFLSQHSGYIISAGPEIFPEYRRQGYAFRALSLAYEYAKGKGYKIASVQIRKDNAAGIRLHEKLGFLPDTEVTDLSGERVICLKLL